MRQRRRKSIRSSPALSVAASGKLRRDFLQLVQFWQHRIGGQRPEIEYHAGGAFLDAQFHFRLVRLGTEHAHRYGIAPFLGRQRLQFGDAFPQHGAAPAKGIHSSP